MQSSWVDEIFGRLSLRYGVQFTRQYADLDIALVKADWAMALDGVSADGVRYALERLPLAPPNAITFRALCGSAPHHAQRPALPKPVSAAPPAVRERLAALRSRIRSRLAEAEAPGADA